MKLSRLLMYLLLLFVLYLLIHNNGTYIPNRTKYLGELERYKLVKVIDGDTIKVMDGSGEVVKVRFIGLDAPESYKTRYGYVECYGKEASKFMKQLLSGKKEVYIKKDTTQGIKDRYGRLLAYVFMYSGGELTNLNEYMIKKGYGWEYTYNKPYLLQKEFKEAEKYAKKHNLGLWGYCGGKRRKEK